MMRSLWKSQSGSAIPIVAVAMMAVIGSAGIAIDMGRVQVVQSRLQNSIDAAGLAAGSVISTENPSTQVNKYFYANYPVGYMGSTITNLVVTPNNDNTELTINATGTVPTSFMRIFGVSQVNIQASSKITRAQRGLELVLVLDVTGSMNDSAGGGVTKMQAAKNASNSLLNILYGTENTSENLWVGLVPFSQAVNIGSSRSTWTTNTALNWGTTSWGGCVEARETSGRDVTDDPPSVAAFPKYYWTCHTSYNDWFGTNTDRDNCSTSGTIRYRSGLGIGLGPNKACPATPITSLVAEKNTVVAGINSLTPNGNTHTVLGISWAWRLLSPRWRGIWGAGMNVNGLPLDYNTPLMNKAVVFMTDGDNTIDNSNRGAYGYLSNGRLGTTNQSNAITQLNNRTVTTCGSMKANGIIIYTIAFGTSFSNASRNMLRSCASKPEFYFESPTGSDLQTVFKRIGDSLANLRVSQ